MTDWKVNNYKLAIMSFVKCDLLRRRRKAERPGEILEAAFEAFAERGYAATRLDDIAARAGVTKGTIYVYFETKEKLFEEMVRSHSQGMLADADAMLAELRGDAVENFRAFLRFLYGRCVGDRRGREIMRFMIADGKMFPQLVAEHYRDFVQPSLAMVGGLLEQGVQSGAFRGDLRRESLNVVIAPMVFFNVLRLIFAESLPVDQEAYIDAHIDMVLHGLRAK